MPSQLSVTLNMTTRLSFAHAVFNISAVLSTVLSILYFAALCVWVAQVCTSGTCVLSGDSCMTNDDCPADLCSSRQINLVCHRDSTGTCTNKACTNLGARKCAQNSDCTVDRLTDQCYLGRCVASAANCNVNTDCEGGSGFYPSTSSNPQKNDDCQSGTTSPFTVQVCQNTGSTCKNSGDCGVNGCEDPPTAVVANSAHFCPSLRGLISMHFLMFIASLIAVFVGHAHKSKM